MKEHLDAEKAKKEAKERRKLEKEMRKEEERRLAEEEETRRKEEEEWREEKKRKKAEKAKQEAMLRAEMKREVALHTTLLISEIKDDWINKMKSSLMPALLAGKVDVKGEKKLKPAQVAGSSSDDSDDGSETSVTQEISDKARQVCISKKRKRVDDVVIEGSPPMELPAKRTPRKTIARLVLISDRMTRSKAKKKGGGITIRTKRKFLVKTPLAKVLKSAKKSPPPSGRITPASKALLRLRFRDAIMRKLKDCNADELQRICREEGLHYEGKIDTILDIAEYRSRCLFPENGPEIGVVPITVSDDTESVDVPANNLSDVALIRIDCGSCADISRRFGVALSWLTGNLSNYSTRLSFY
ncbi:hypothetical protein CBR_g68767 [Chara braunii]|uniref:Uncharacterized protein n=1 Tax=Chara braunii TaxID=69332 RepID=A0A388K9T2_CHABU|nr:hypothetical protein CBR_g68767 [Chara braunii]|eukprot:GBG66781.1 hypothetical protein CBR_g68767 [Chara braunii]